MDRLTEYLSLNRIILLDGSTGTELGKRGIADPPIKADLEKPYEVWKLAREYYMAGSDAVLTNSLTGSTIMLGMLGVGADAYSINKQAATLACKARPEGKLVIGSVGPIGELLEPYGPLSESEAISAFIPQLKGLSEVCVDAIVFETFLDLREMDCAIKALKEVSDMPFICSLTYDYGPKGYSTMMGDTIGAAVEFGRDRGAYAVGANCGVGIDQMIRIIGMHRKIDPDILLWAKPNAGNPELVDNRLAYNETPEYFAKRLPELLSQEVSFVGGCCGTGPDHIAAMRDVIRERT